MRASFLSNLIKINVEGDRFVLVDLNNNNIFVSVPSAYPQEPVTRKFRRFIIYIAVDGICICDFFT